MALAERRERWRELMKRLLTKENVFCVVTTAMLMLGIWFIATGVAYELADIVKVQVTVMTGPKPCGTRASEASVLVAQVPLHIEAQKWIKVVDRGPSPENTEWVWAHADDLYSFLYRVLEETESRR
jgi:hypothetical protein